MWLVPRYNCTRLPVVIRVVLVRVVVAHNDGKRQGKWREQEPVSSRRKTGDVKAKLDTLGNTSGSSGCAVK